MKTLKIPQLTKSLIACKTTSDNTSLSKALQIVHQITRTDGLQSQILDNEGNKMIWISNHTFNQPDLLILGHMDVVAAPPELFVPKEKDGKIFGRGAFDMKGPIAAMVSAVTEAKTSKNIQLLITSDEEVGGTKCARWFFEKKGIVPRIAIVPDGIEANQTIVKQKGPWHFVITAKGISTHGSHPWEGKNPIQTLVRIINRIDCSEKQALKTSDWLPTFTVTNIEAKSSINQLPTSAQMTVDIRTTNQQQISRIKHIIKEENAVITKLYGDGRIFIQKETEVIKQWQKLTGFRAAISPGASDARHIPSSTDVIVTQTLGADAHGLHEWVDIESLAKLAAVTKLFINKL